MSILVIDLEKEIIYLLTLQLICMNNENVFEQILSILPLTALPIFIITYASSALKKTDEVIKKHNAEEQNSEYERQELEKYLSGFDYV